jgi:hypothetical protein
VSASTLSTCNTVLCTRNALLADRAPVAASRLLWTTVRTSPSSRHARRMPASSVRTWRPEAAASKPAWYARPAASHHHHHSCGWCCSAVPCGSWCWQHPSSRLSTCEQIPCDPIQISYTGTCPVLCIEGKQCALHVCLCCAAAEGEAYEAVVGVRRRAVPAGNGGRGRHTPVSAAVPQVPGRQEEGEALLALPLKPCATSHHSASATQPYVGTRCELRTSLSSSTDPLTHLLPLSLSHSSSLFHSPSLSHALTLASLSHPSTHSHSLTRFPLVH